MKLFLSRINYLSLKNLNIKLRKSKINLNLNFLTSNLKPFSSLVIKKDANYFIRNEIMSYKEEAALNNYYLKNKSLLAKNPNHLTLIFLQKIKFSNETSKIEKLEDDPFFEDFYEILSKNFQDLNIKQVNILFSLLSNNNNKNNLSLQLKESLVLKNICFKILKKYDFNLEKFKSSKEIVDLINNISNIQSLFLELNNNNKNDLRFTYFKLKLFKIFNSFSKKDLTTLDLLSLIHSSSYLNLSYKELFLDISEELKLRFITLNLKNLILICYSSSKLGVYNESLLQLIKERINKERTLFKEKIENLDKLYLINFACFLGETKIQFDNLIYQETFKLLEKHVCSFIQFSDDLNSSSNAYNKKKVNLTIFELLKLTKFAFKFAKLNPLIKENLKEEFLENIDLSKINNYSLFQLIIDKFTYLKKFENENELFDRYIPYIINYLSKNSYKLDLIDFIVLSGKLYQLKLDYPYLFEKKQDKVYLSILNENVIKKVSFDFLMLDEIFQFLEEVKINDLKNKKYLKDLIQILEIASFELEQYLDYHLNLSENLKNAKPLFNSKSNVSVIGLLYMIISLDLKISEHMVNKLKNMFALIESHNQLFSFKQKQIYNLIINYYNLKEIKEIPLDRKDALISVNTFKSSLFKLIKSQYENIFIQTDLVIDNNFVDIYIPIKKVAFTIIPRLNIFKFNLKHKMDLDNYSTNLIKYKLAKSSIKLITITDDIDLQDTEFLLKLKSYL